MVFGQAVRTLNVRANHPLKSSMFTLLNLQRKEVLAMNVDDLLNIEELEIEPITDEILASVLGGLGEDDGWFVPSCSNTDCSNKPKLEEPAG